MSQAADDTDDDIPAEIDFSGAQRGGFYRLGASLRLPVYLDAEVHRRLTAEAGAEGIALNRLVNDLLKADIESMDAARYSEPTAGAH